MKRPYGLALAVAVAALPLAVSYLGESLSVDTCLDAGGSYDYATKRCDHAISHPYVPYLVRHASLVYGTGIVMVLGAAAAIGLTRKTEAARAPSTRAGA
jgi:hypothetical protein